VVCHSETGPVCEHCLEDIDTKLYDLPARLARVTEALEPGQAPAGERVAVSSRVHAGLPARVDALSLVGPGGDVPAALHPLVRHWSVKRKVHVITHVVGRARRVQVEVTDWFHEAVIGDDGRPVMVPDGDQVGIVPPREWLDMQVRRWRAHFGHRVPPRTMLGEQRPYLPAAYRTLLARPDGPTVIGFLLAAHRASGAGQRMAYHGLLATEHPDPAMAAIERRDQPGEPPRSMGWDIKYLRAWLPKACSEDVLDIAAFTAELRALHGEIDRALGETPDRERIGRCPAFIAELDSSGEPTGRKRPCGAELWQENGAYMSAQVSCHRCRTTWDTRGNAGAGTAREIRRVWPLDRRRRYTAEEIARLRLPKCPGCGGTVKVQWRDVTGTRDRERTWQPDTARCDNGCDEARRVL
jgi:hypothetical protein